MNKNPSLTESTFSGMKWKSYASLFQIGSKLLVNIILARILAPKDFGLISISQIFIGIGMIFINTGLGSAIIQKQSLSENHVRSGFTLSIFLGIILMCTLWFTAPLIADYFDALGATMIIRLISLTLLLDSIVAIPISAIRKELKYKELFIFTTGSFLFGYALVAILFAVSGFGVYALAFGVLGRSCIGVVIGCRLYAKRGLFLKFGFFKREIFEIVRFGGWTALTNLLAYVTNNIDYFIVGKWLNTYSLGIYTKAFQFMQVGSANLTAVVSNVMFPSLSQVQNEKEKLKKVVLGIVPILSVMLFSVLIFLFLNSECIVLGLLGDKWIDTIKPLRILCLAGYFRGIYKIADVVLFSLGKVAGQFAIHLVYLCLLFICAMVGVKWGIDGISYAVGFSTMVVCVMLYAYVSSFCSISIRDWVRCATTVLPYGITYGILLLVVSRLVSGCEHYSVQLLFNCFFAIVGMAAMLMLLRFRVFNSEVLWILEKINPYLPKWFKIIIGNFSNYEKPYN